MRGGRQAGKIIGLLALAGALAACASDSGPRLVWSGGNPKQLAADEAGCHQEAAGLDIQEANGYSNARYGLTSAMAEAIARDNPLADRDAIVREAAFETCMNDKGWTSSQQ